MIVVAAAVIVLAAALVVLVRWGGREIDRLNSLILAQQPPAPPPPPPPVPPPVEDHTLVMMREMSAMVTQVSTQTAEAIGKAVQAAQFAPPPPPPQVIRRMALDPDVEAGIVDMSDPTDHGWLVPGRPEVADWDGTSPPIPGVEMRP